MRNLYEGLKIDGVPILTPDQDVEMEYNDLDSEETGRDESGVMHRIVARYKVASWGFQYSALTEEEKRYMENLFPNAPSFTFGHPSRLDASVMEETVCYRSKYGITWQNAVTGLWSGYNFNIIEC
jgi:hypothetical protein